MYKKLISESLKQALSVINSRKIRKQVIDKIFSEIERDRREVDEINDLPIKLVELSQEYLKETIPLDNSVELLEIRKKYINSIVRLLENISNEVVKLLLRILMSQSESDLDYKEMLLGIFSLEESEVQKFLYEVYHIEDDEGLDNNRKLKYIRAQILERREKLYKQELFIMASRIDWRTRKWLLDNPYLFVSSNNEENIIKIIREQLNVIGRLLDKIPNEDIKLFARIIMDQTENDLDHLRKLLDVFIHDPHTISKFLLFISCSSESLCGPGIEYRLERIRYGVDKYCKYDYWN